MKPLWMTGKHTLTATLVGAGLCGPSVIMDVTWRPAHAAELHSHRAWSAAGALGYAAAVFALIMRTGACAGILRRHIRRGHLAASVAFALCGGISAGAVNAVISGGLCAAPPWRGYLSAVAAVSQRGGSALWH